MNLISRAEFLKAVGINMALIDRVHDVTGLPAYHRPDGWHVFIDAADVERWPAIYARYRDELRRHGGWMRYAEAKREARNA